MGKAAEYNCDDGYRKKHAQQLLLPFSLSFRLRSLQYPPAFPGRCSDQPRRVKRYRNRTIASVML
jgi:hypothetical protein